MHNSAVAMTFRPVLTEGGAGGGLGGRGFGGAGGDGLRGGAAGGHGGRGRGPAGRGPDGADPGPGGGPRDLMAGVRDDASRVECEDCGTAISITMASADVMVFQVRGNTCASCNPAAVKHRDSALHEDRVEETLRAWWAGDSTAEARWSITRGRGDDRGVRPRRDFVPEPMVAENRLPEVDSEWRGRLAPLLADAVGEAWQVAAEAWQPQYCRILDALAALLDFVWTEVVALAGGVTRLVIRLTGLPPVVAIALREMTFRVPRTSWPANEPVGGIAVLYRAFGCLGCAATGHVTACAEVRRHLVHVPERPTTDALERLAPPRVLLALTATSDLPTLDDLLGRAPITRLASGEPPVVPPPDRPKVPIKSEAETAPGLPHTIGVFSAIGGVPQGQSTFGRT